MKRKKNHPHLATLSMAFSVAAFALFVTVAAQQGNDLPATVIENLGSLVAAQ